MAFEAKSALYMCINIIVGIAYNKLFGEAFKLERWMCIKMERSERLHGSQRLDLSKRLCIIASGI